MGKLTEAEKLIPQRNEINTFRVDSGAIMPFGWAWGWSGIGSGLMGGVIVCIQGASNWGGLVPERAQGSESLRGKTHQCMLELANSKGSLRTSCGNITWELLEVQMLRSHSRPPESEPEV